MDSIATVETPPEPVFDFDIKLSLQKPAKFSNRRVSGEPYCPTHVAFHMPREEAMAMQYLVSGLEAQGALAQFRKSRMTPALAVRHIVRAALQEIRRRAKHALSSPEDSGGGDGM